MYNEKLEALIEAALEDGVLTEKEKQVLFKNAQAMGIDLDEFEMVLDARLVKMQKEAKAQAQAAAPKSNKFGDIKKCPNCGAMVQSYQGKCPECGYAFEGIEANSATKELSKLLQQANDHKQMIKVIETFPIPMDKAVLIDFISWLKPQCLDVKNPLCKSYSKKYDECIHKARITFASDKELAPLIAEYDSVQKQIKKAKHSENLKSLLKAWWFWVALGLLILISMMVIFIKSNTQIVTEALDNNDLELAYSIISKDISVEQSLGSQYFDKCLELNELERAETFMANQHTGDEYHYKKQYIKKCIEQDKIDKAESFCKTNYDRDIAKILYDYFMQKRDFEKAEKYTRFFYPSLNQGPYTTWYEEEHFEFIMDLVTSLCEDGKKQEARNMAKKYIERYDWRKDGRYSKQYVTSKINQFIDNF